MGKKSRDKGARSERHLVKILQEDGFAAERVPLSGAMGGRFGADVSIPILGADKRGEVKVRANGFKQIYDWLVPGVDFLFHKSDRNEWLVTLRLRDGIEIAKHAEGQRDGLVPIVARRTD
jgi:Holliday junction resolvase